MKGYKGTYGMKCRTLTYEVGKTYSIDNMEMCSHGFHFCQEMKDVLNYYEYSKDFVLLEVEALGEVITDDDNSVTDKLKILRVVPKEEYVGFPICEYDANNNLTYRKTNGFEEWREYDSNNNEIYRKYSNEFEVWREYDVNNNQTHYRDSNEVEEWCEYDSNNNRIYREDSNGLKEWWEYDSNNNLIHFENSNKFEVWREYDVNNNQTHHKNSNGLKEWKEYDSNNNLIHFKNSEEIEWRITITD